MKEIWKDIKGYEGKYQVSNLGNVKSLERFDKYNRYVKEKILIPRKHTGGYLRVGLSRKDFYIHRLVAEAFIPNLKNKKYINHIDGDKTNNNINNLEWCTANENMQHAYYILKYADSDFMSKIANCKNHEIAMIRKRKLTNKQILEIRKSKMPENKLAIIYNVSRSYINSIKNFKVCKDVK